LRWKKVTSTRNARLPQVTKDQIKKQGKSFKQEGTNHMILNTRTQILNTQQLRCTLSRKNKVQQHQKPKQHSRYNFNHWIQIQGISIINWISIIALESINKSMHCCINYVLKYREFNDWTSSVLKRKCKDVRDSFLREDKFCEIWIAFIQDNWFNYIAKAVTKWSIGK
jgi:hypothetical protein